MNKTRSSLSLFILIYVFIICQINGGFSFKIPLKNYYPHKQNAGLSVLGILPLKTMKYLSSQRMFFYGRF